MTSQGWEMTPQAREMAKALRYHEPMNAAKKEVMDLLEHLPDDTSLEDIQYHIYVRQKIEHGLEDLAAGRTMSDEELDRRMAKWLEP